MFFIFLFFKFISHDHFVWFDLCWCVWFTQESRSPSKSTSPLGPRRSVACSPAHSPAHWPVCSLGRLLEDSSSSSSILFFYLRSTSVMSDKTTVIFQCYVRYNETVLGSFLWTATEVGWAFEHSRLCRSQHGSHTHTHYSRSHFSSRSCGRWTPSCSYSWERRCRSHLAFNLEIKHKSPNSSVVEMIVKDIQ